MKQCTKPARYDRRQFQQNARSTQGYTLRESGDEIDLCTRRGERQASQTTVSRGSHLSNKDIKLKWSPITSNKILIREVLSRGTGCSKLIQIYGLLS